MSTGVPAQAESSVRAGCAAGRPAAPGVRGSQVMDFSANPATPQIQSPAGPILSTMATGEGSIQPGSVVLFGRTVCLSGLLHFLGRGSKQFSQNSSDEIVEKTMTW